MTKISIYYPSFTLHCILESLMGKKKWLREFTLGVAQGRNPQAGYREIPTLLSPTPRRVTDFKRGVPIFSKAIDTIQNLATGNRQYRAAQKLVPVVTDFTEANFHEMKGKFQFYISGSFPNGGVQLEEEIHRCASELHMVGFMKVRSYYALGHFQGDPFSLSYIRKWMEDRCNTSGVIDAVHIFDDSYGIPEFRYTKLECIKDWRSPIRRKQHMAAIHEETRLANLQTRSRNKESELSGSPTSRSISNS